MERMFRASPVTRDVPLFWLQTEVNPVWPQPKYKVTGGAASGYLDLLDSGAYDILERVVWTEQVKNRFAWALGGKSLGEELPRSISLITADNRVRYRIGL